jgi:hypothetical protein
VISIFGLTTGSNGPFGEEGIASSAICCDFSSDDMISGLLADVD